MGIKKGIAVENFQKPSENDTFFKANCWFFESESVVALKKTRDFFMSLFVKEQREQFAHGCSLKRAILSEERKY